MRVSPSFVITSVRVPKKVGVSPFHSRAHDRFVLADALFELGRLDEAEAWFGSLTEGTDFAYVAPAHLRLAAIERAQGNLGAAGDHLARAASMWTTAEPPLLDVLHRAIELEPAISATPRPIAHRFR